MSDRVRTDLAGLDIDWAVMGKDTTCGQTGQGTLRPSAAPNPFWRARWGKQEQVWVRAGSPLRRCVVSDCQCNGQPANPVDIRAGHSGLLTECGSRGGK